MHTWIINLTRAVIGKASAVAQRLRIRPGRKSGPVVVFSSMQFRILRVQRVRRCMKLEQCWGKSSAVRGIISSGEIPSLNLRSNTSANKFDLSTGSSIHWFDVFCRAGIDSRGDVVQ